MRKFKLDARFVITPENVEQVRAYCSPSEKFTWVTPTERLRIHTLRGVPGKHIDVLLPDAVPAGVVVCEVGRKVGSYDHVQRWRICVRSWDRAHGPEREHDPNPLWPGPGSLRIEEEGDEIVLVARWKPTGVWAQAFHQLRYRPAPGDRTGILLHHWKGWYHFLPEDDVRQVAAVWSALPHTLACEDISVLNRTASQALYDLAVQLGWRKLTMREKRRLGLADDSPSWQRQERCAALAAKVNSTPGNPSGCGDHSIRTAYGAYTEDEFGED